MKHFHNVKHYAIHNLDLSNVFLSKLLKFKLAFSSVLWCCLLADGKSILSVKNSLQ